MPEGIIVATVVGVVVVIALIWFLVRALSRDKVKELIEKRKSTAIISGPAQYVEGPERADIALTLTKDTIYYENADIQARLDLNRIDEVDYDDDLSMSKTPAHVKVLRLRSHGQTFEFLIDEQQIRHWQEHLPPHRMGEPGEVHAE